MLITPELWKLESPYWWSYFSNTCTEFALIEKFLFLSMDDFVTVIERNGRSMADKLTK
jgi:hypothetical protein